jgi:hypothetical protein
MGGRERKRNISTSARGQIPVLRLSLVPVSTDETPRSEIPIPVTADGTLPAPTGQQAAVSRCQPVGGLGTSTHQINSAVTRLSLRNKTVPPSCKPNC